MTRHFFQADCVAVDGPKYELERTFSAYEHVIDALCTAFECSVSTVSTASKGFEKAIQWPDPGKEVARQTWRRCAEHYDVVDAALVHHIGPLTVKAFLLGKTWLVYHPEDDRLSTPTNGEAHEIDPVPMVCVYGENLGDGNYGIVATEHMAIVRRVLDQFGPSLGIEVEIATASTDEGVVAGYLAWISFSDARYRSGIGSIMVKVVQQDGSPVPDSFKARAN